MYEIDIRDEEALIETEQHCIAMQRYLGLPPQKRAVVDRFIEAARILQDHVGPREPNARVYETARNLAEGLRGQVKP